jgi:hypothetical protein
MIFPNSSLATKSVKVITKSQKVPSVIRLQKNIFRRKKSPNQSTRNNCILNYQTIYNTSPSLEVNLIKEISTPYNNNKIYMNTLQPQTIGQPIDFSKVNSYNTTIENYNNIYNNIHLNIIYNYPNNKKEHSRNIFNKKNNSINFNKNNVNSFSGNYINNRSYANNEFSINNNSTSTFNTYKNIEPDSNFNLLDFIKIGIIGKGAEGILYSVIWKKNNKKYALKVSKIKEIENVQKKQNEIKIFKKFRKLTGNDGVIKAFGELCVRDKFGYFDFYEIMELAQIDWDQEIYKRGRFHLYYQEKELLHIMKQNN